MIIHTYLLLTVFEFFLLGFMAQTRSSERPLMIDARYLLHARLSVKTLRNQLKVRVISFCVLVFFFVRVLCFKYVSKFSSRDIFQKQTCEFSGPYSGVQPAKLTNHSARIN